MAAKTPIRAVFTGSDATGLSEFQSGEFVDYTFGGTGLTSLGSAGQVLKINSGGTALEYGNVEAVINIDGATDLTGSTLVASDQIILSDGGTEGRVTLSQLDTLFSGTTQTLTNKTLTSPTITGTGAIAGTFTGNITGDVTGNADTATTLETARTIAGQSFDGSSNITIASTDLSNTSDVVLLTSTQTLTNKTLTSPTITGTGAIAGTFTGNITGDVTGNADTATALETARTIAGQSFDGTANITIAATDLSDTDQSLSTTDNVTFNNMTVSGNLTVSGTTTTVNSTTIEITNSFTFEGSTADDYETVFGVIDPTADRTINLPNVSGTLPVLAAASTTQITATPEELNYVDGVTSAIQTQLNSKQATITGGATTITGSNLTVSRALVSDGSGKVAVSAVTSTELGYLDGVTSAIQTQLNTKASQAFAIAQAIALG